MADAIDIGFLKQAIEISKQARPAMTHFSVGAVLVDKNRAFVASGFTQELGEGWHAEAAAIKKAMDTGFDPKGATIYSTIEPCSVRASGKGDCSTFLIEKGIIRVVFALSEPPIFVTCQGKSKLKAAGIKVEQIINYKDAVIAINKHLLSTQGNQIKSKLIAYAVCNLLVYYACSFNQVFASYPQVDNKKTEPNMNQQTPQALIGHYYTQALQQLNELYKNDLKAKNLVDSQGKINENQLSKTIDTLPVKNNQINKSLEFMKGLIYDPSNPTPFFNNLIAMQSMSAAAQNQLILLGEGSLGAKNSYVVGLKENYSHTLKYLDALKQQKILLEQTIQAPHK